MIDAFSSLGANRTTDRIPPPIFRLQFHFLKLGFNPVDICAWQIDFVNARQNFEVVLKCQIKVRDGLGFDALGGIDDEQRERLLKDPSLLRSAIEEMLRFNPSSLPMPPAVYS